MANCRQTAIGRKTMRQQRFDNPNNIIKLKAAIIKRIDLMSNSEGRISGFGDTEVDELINNSLRSSIRNKSIRNKSISGQSKRFTRKKL